MFMQDYILVENISESDISIMLSNLANLYSDTGYTDGIELSKSKSSEQKFLVSFQNIPDFEHFAYFVNYIHYPADVEVSKMYVRGFYKVKEGDSTKDFNPGESLQLYVSQNDTEYDNVSIVNSINQGYLFDFGDKTKKLEYSEEKYQLSGADRANYSVLKIVSPSSTPLSPESTDGSSKPWWKFW